MLGLGGGAVIAPLLVLTLGLPQHQAQGVSLAALIPPVGLPAIFAYRRLGVRPDWKVIGLLIIGFVLGTFGGAKAAQALAANTLRWTLAIFLLLTAASVASSRGSPCTEGEPGHEALTRSTPPLGTVHRERALAIGIASGFFSGLLGIGGAIVALPLLQKWVGLDRLTAQMATLAMLLPPIGLPALYVYATEPAGLPWPYVAACAVSFAAVAGFGARLSGRLSDRLARRGYVSLLVLLVALLLIHK
jgi:uncharacterized membrane protein YfcA